MSDLEYDRGPFMQTSLGGKFYPFDPRAEEVTIADIARGLSQTCRYGGQCSRFYSVAEHAVIVSQYVPPQYAREALLHDSAEAYIGDMIRPIKHYQSMMAFRDIEAMVELAVNEHFGLNWTHEAWEAVKEIDDRVLVDEMTALMPNPSLYTDRHPNVAPLGAHIAGLIPEHAEFVFITRFLQLFPEHALRSKRVG